MNHENEEFQDFVEEEMVKKENDHESEEFQQTQEGESNFSNPYQKSLGEAVENLTSNCMELFEDSSRKMKYFTEELDSIKETIGNVTSREEEKNRTVQDNYQNMKETIKGLYSMFQMNEE